MLPSWYIVSLKLKGKGDCKNLIHLSSVSCLLIFFNLVDEFGSYITHINRRAQRPSKHKTEQKHKRSTKEVPPWNSKIFYWRA